ncbi:MAG TPA: T9SS type A sorting domain-containing protein [Bacteroidia bacterium]|jgi:hypothetical protein|nr:T9SS type A sorting domain-containing protein [Bacteroidia bacterium]
MKKNTLLAISVLGIFAFSANVSGQIAISTSDLPYAGETVTVQEDSTSNTLLPGAPGTSETWSFGALKSQKASTVMFTTPGATKYSAAFSASDNIADSTAGGNGHYYFMNTSSEFAVQGVQEFVTDATYGVTFLVELNFNPVFVQAELPGYYNTNYSGVSNAKDEFAATGFVAFVYDSIIVTVQISYQDTVDAWGTMTTPTGTYPVLRQNHHEVDVERAYGRASSGTLTVLDSSTTAYHQYNWYTTGANYILAQMNVNPSNGAYQNVKWDAAPPADAGIQNISQYAGGIITYPNPCTSQITFQSVAAHDAQFVSIFDVTGRQLEKVSMANGMVVLNTSTYSSGIYFYNIIDKSGNIVDKGKFSVR